MTGRLVSASLVLAVTAVATALPASGSVLRRHRLLLPTPPLPNSLTVDESEWVVVPSQRVISAGTDTFQVYDRGQDEHNLTIQGPITHTSTGPIRAQIWLQSGAMGTIVVKLPAGTYKLYCSMFAGTPQSHEMLGMHTLISVR